MIWGLSIMTAMGATAHFLKKTVNNAFFLRSESVSQNARASVQEYLDRQARDLGSFAQEMGQSPTLEESTFQEKAVRLLRDAPAFFSVAFLDDQYRREWVFPYAVSRVSRGTGLTSPSDAMNAAKRSLKTGQPTASGLVDLVHGGTGVLVYSPVFREALWQGLVEGPIQVTRMALDLISPAVGKDFHYSIIDERQGREIYSTLSQEDRAMPSAYDSFFTLALADRTWWVLLHPQSPPPTLAVVVGTLSAEAIFGVLVFFLWRKRK